jgi:YggT family protein
MSDDFLTPVDRREEVIDVETPNQRVRRSVIRDVGAEHALNLARVVNVVWLMVGILEVLLGLRAALKLMAANPANPFAHFIYSFTDLFLWPFFGLTVTPASSGMVLEIPTLIAMVVYAFLGWLVVRLIWLAFEKPRARAISNYEEYD